MCICQCFIKIRVFVAERGKTKTRVTNHWKKIPYASDGIENNMDKRTQVVFNKH